jgi:hypothetical protein
MLARRRPRLERRVSIRLIETTAEVREFAEAYEAFASGYAVTPEQLLELGQYAYDRAFTYAGAAQLEVIKRVRASLLDAVYKGTPLHEWQRSIRTELERDWGAYRPLEGIGNRIETIARNASQKAYNAGRYQQLRDPTIVRLRPFWMFDSILDSRTSEICIARGSPPVILPQGDPWWGTNWPPLHHRCRSAVRALRKREVDRKGGVREPPTGAPSPTGDWGATPDTERPWHPKPEDVPPALSRAFALKIEDKPPRPMKIEVGRHIQEIVGGDDEQRAAVVQAFADAGVAPALEKLPLRKIRIGDALKGGNSTGYYYPESHEIELTSQTQHGLQWEPGKIIAVQFAAVTRTQYMKMLSLHELGHHLHLTAGADIARDIASEYGRARPISMYAKTDADEWIAESFSVYCSRREELRKHDPVAYRMIVRILQSHGIDAH